MSTPSQRRLELDPSTLSKFDREAAWPTRQGRTKEDVPALLHVERAPDARAVGDLHFDPSVAVSLLADVDPRDALPPLTAYLVMRVGRLPLVAYIRPATKVLAKAVGALPREHHAVLSPITVPSSQARSLENARYATEELEETAKLFSCCAASRSAARQGKRGDLRQRYNLR